jgi:hypothetical protein
MVRLIFLQDENFVTNHDRIGNLKRYLVVLRCLFVKCL